jgi:hypothetical protein
MSWSAAFVEQLESRARSPVFIVEVIQVADAPFAGSVTLCTHPGFFTDYTNLALRGISTQGQQLTPGSWSTSAGAFSFTVVGDPAPVFEYLTRGSMVRLLMGFPGWQPADFQPIAVGMVRNIRGAPPAWTVECWDIFSALKTRLSTTASRLGLFYNIGATTTLSSSYSIGDGSITVASTTGFDRENAGIGIAKVTPDSGTPFYLRWSAMTATVFTISGSGTEHFGTTRAAAASGKSVTEVAYLSGHPIDIARKVLASKGVTGNGAYDLYPIDWGFGLPDYLLDHDDMDNWRDLVVTIPSGSYIAEFLVEARQDDAIGWLTDWLAKFGLFFRMRQGHLSIGAAQSYGSGAYPYRSSLILTDEDIAGEEGAIQYEAFDSDVSTEYGNVQVFTKRHDGTTSSDTTAEDPATLPATSTLQNDLNGYVWGLGSTGADAITTEVMGRISEAALRVPERFVVRCAGLRMAQLAPGDAFVVNSTRFVGRSGWYGSASALGRAALVQAVTPDWVRGTVELSLLVYPTTSAAFAP